LSDNDLIVDYTGGSPLATMTNQIKAARGTGSWNGNGITSSLADATHYALGIAEASDVIGAGGGTFSGQAVDGTAVLVKYTYYGDADLNGLINFDDYSRTDNGFNTGGSTWPRGDFDYNGAVNFDDYSLIDAAFNTQGGTLRIALAYLDGEHRDRDNMNTPELRVVMEHFDQFGVPYAQSFLNAVPEPTSALALAGVQVLACMRRRRRSRSTGAHQSRL